MLKFGALCFPLFSVLLAGQRGCPDPNAVPVGGRENTVRRRVVGGERLYRVSLRYLRVVGGGCHRSDEAGPAQNRAGPGVSS